MLDKLRHRLLNTLARLVADHPCWVLAVALILALASVALTVTNLSFQSDRNDLISDSLDWNRRYIEWESRFPGNADLIVVVSTADTDGQVTTASRQAAMHLIDDLAPRLKALDSADQVLWGFNPNEAHPIAIQLLPLGEFTERLAEIGDAAMLLESATPGELIGRILQRMRTEMAQGDQTLDDPQTLALARDQLRDFQQLIAGFTLRLQTPAEQPVDLLAAMVGQALSDWEYFETQNGRMMFIRVTPRMETGHLTRFERTLREVRATMEAVRKDHPGVDYGLTGIEVIETDETDAFTFDATIASILAATLIATLLILAFHSLRVPLMLMATLAIGVAWSFGFLTLAIGHLQVISVVFTAILLGLGVGFGIHLATRYQMVRRNYPDDAEGFVEALKDTISTMGPGVITGAITTSAAFCTTLLTDFRGVAEMGLVAGVGVLLCMIAMFTVFPALLRLFKWRHHHVPENNGRLLTLYDERWVGAFARRPRATLIGGIAVFALSVLAITQMRFDYNLMDLLPRGVDSVQWAQRVMTEGGESVYFGVSVCDSLEEAKRRAELFLEKPMIESVGGIGRIFPDELALKREKLNDLAQHLGPALAQAQTPDASTAAPTGLISQMSLLGITLNTLANQVPEALAQDIQGLRQNIATFVSTAQALSESERTARLAALQENYQQMRTTIVGQIEPMFADRSVRLDDLPAALMDPWIGQYPDGQRYALEVYSRLPEGAESPLDPAVLGPFINQMREVDPDVTGVIVQIFESGRLIWTSYVQAGVLALLVVLILVWIDFRRIGDALLTLVPVALGFAATFGVMYLTGIQINPANIIVLPLMFGIGVDAGVHMIHRFRMSRDAFPPGLSSGTGRAISLTTYTTMIGFGSMMIASHRGIVSLGMVMALGLGLTLLACWSVMPAILALRAKACEKAT